MTTTDKTHEKVCPVCKKPFTTNYSWQKYDSDECRIQNGMKPPKPVLEGTCLWCHAKFKKARDNWQKFCDIDCRDEFNRVKHQIEVKYFFEHDKRHEELEKLAVLGQNYGVD